jgi:hypothetical protein
MMQPARTKNKITSDYGMKDYYKYYKETNPSSEVTRVKYNKIISQINEEIINMMLNESFEYKLPHINATLTIRKDKRKPTIKDGKVVNSSPVDWVTTKKLWEEDPETKEKGLLVRYLNTHTAGYVFRIYLKKFGASIKNRSYYKFKPSRKFQRALSARIKDDNKDKFDTYLLY